MNTVKNPAKSRPLSANVRRLMKMARETPANPAVWKIEREFSARDVAYCDMQGNIFMAAIDRGLDMQQFAPVYMNSQLAGVMDHSFSCAGGMEHDDVSRLLKVSMLLKSPGVIVDVVVWLNGIVNRLQSGESANMAVVQACLSEDAQILKQITVVNQRCHYAFTDEYLRYRQRIITASAPAVVFAVPCHTGMVAAGRSAVVMRT